jgi:hypothetical protein
MGLTNNCFPFRLPGKRTESEEKPHSSGNPVGFRGSVQLLQTFFRNGENGPFRGQFAGCGSELNGSSPCTWPGRQVKVVLVSVIKDGNEQITGDRRISRQGEDD